jgi:hypothetical protein
MAEKVLDIILTCGKKRKKFFGMMVMLKEVRKIFDE